MPKEYQISKRQRVLQDEILRLSEFLAPLREIWAKEVLNTFPETKPAFQPAWIETLRELDEAEELALENGESIAHWKESSLKSLFQQLSLLEKLPVLPTEKLPPYPSWALNKVSGKKQHEIEKIVSILPVLGLKPRDTYVDIGGGKGHLSRILSLYHGLDGVTLDTNAEFQRLGKERLDKYPPPEGAGKIRFVCHTFGPETEEGKLLEKNLFSQAKGSFGLHTCGPLALHHLKKAKKEHFLLNFGCCYQKLSPSEAATSQFVREKSPYLFSKYALTLASRGHTTIDLKDYKIKKLVKYKRAALHFFLLENHFETTFSTVGSTHPRNYQKSFSHYALAKLEQKGIEVAPEALDAFFEKKETQEKLNFIYHANMIRWRFGRILEKLIILDRTLALLEKGQDAYCFEIFDSKLSPRNIGILVNPAEELDFYIP